MGEPRLPCEIVRRIVLELVADAPEDSEAVKKGGWFKDKPCKGSGLRADLAPLLLVSRYFADIVRPEIYRSIRIYTNTDISDKLVQRMLSSSALPYVQSLRLEWSRQCCPARYLPLRIKGRCARLSQFLHSLPSLRSLDIVFCDDQRHHVVQLELLLGRLVSEDTRFHLEHLSFNAHNEVVYKMRVRIIEELLLKHRHTLTSLRLRGPWARELVFSARPLSKLSKLHKLDLQDVSVRHWPSAREEWEARCHAKHYKGWNSEDYGNDLLFDFDKGDVPDESRAKEIEHDYRLVKPRLPSTPGVSGLPPAAHLVCCRFSGPFDDFFKSILPMSQQAQDMSVALEKQDQIEPTSGMIQLPLLSSLEIRYYDCDSETMDDHPCPKPVGDNLTQLLELFAHTDAEDLTIAVSRAYDFGQVTERVIDLLARSHWVFPRCRKMALKLDCSEPAFSRQQNRSLLSAEARGELAAEELHARGISLSISALTTRL